MELALRPYRTSDYEILARWYAEREPFRHAIGDRLLEASLPGLLSGKPGLRMLVTDEGRTVGLIAAERKTHRNGAILWIRLLLVEPEVRRRGCGKAALMRLYGLEGIGSGTGIRKILVAVDEANEEGMAFWRAMGFRSLHRLRAGNESSVKPVRILIREVCSA